MVPDYHNSYFSQNKNIHNYNTSLKTDLHLPRVKLQLGKRTFRLNGTYQFNNLPADLKMINSFSSFKNRLRKHFLSLSLSQS